MNAFSDTDTFCESTETNLENPHNHYATSNAEFLDAIFQGITDPLRPFVTHIQGAPKDAKRGWGGTSYKSGLTVDSLPDRNWYFTLAIYTPRADGKYGKTEKDCAAIYGVMLDDVGTKALPLERLAALPPSFVIETSPGNHQASYLFNEPQTDIKRITSLNQSLVEANLCDPGAKSPATRWGRLPFASNCKASLSEPFRCRLVDFSPDRRYTIEQIIEGLDLAPPESQKTEKPANPGRKAAAIDRNADDVYAPRPEENEVIRALKSRGLYKKPLGGGKHDVTCPWVHEHTDGADSGACYFEPDDTHPVGGYRCHHSHGGTKRIGALLEHLGVSFRAAKHKPTIKVEPGELHRIVDAAERELAATGRYYQRGGLIVAVQSDPENGATAIKPVSQPSLVRALSGVAVWERYDSRAQAYVICDPPARHTGVLFDSEGYEHLPVLSGLARQPHLRPDGSVVTLAGYDAPTFRFGVFDSRQFTIGANPSKADAKAALEQLRGLLSEFEFAEPHDESAAIAAMLTAAIRPSLSVAPMFHVRAPQIASGKSYLCGLIAAFASAAIPSAHAFPTTEEEAHKLIMATLLESPAVIAFDNLTTDLIPFKTICSALTEEYLTGRILGISKTVTVGTNALFLSSGNNVDPVRDMVRRCVVIALDPQTEIPAQRKFTRDPQSTLRANRARYVSLALSIVRAWIVAGKPMTECPALGSYGQWSDWVRQPLLWLGLPDPAGRLFSQLAHDPDRELLGRVLVAWRGAFGQVPTAVRDAVAHAERNSGSELTEVINDIASERGEINRRRLGRWIVRHQGRIVSGQRFERAAAANGAERWMVKMIAKPQSNTAPESEQQPANFYAAEVF